LTLNDILTLLLRAPLDRKTPTKEQEMGGMAGPSKERARIPRGDHVAQVLGEFATNANTGPVYFAASLTCFGTVFPKIKISIYISLLCIIL
jgi:hypothetical protein